MKIQFRLMTIGTALSLIGMLFLGLLIALEQFDSVDLSFLVVYWSAWFSIMLTFGGIAVIGVGAYVWMLRVILSR